MVIEHRLDPLLPLAALLDQRVTQPDPRAQIEDVIGRDPRLRQPPEQQQLAQMPRVGTVVLGALLVPAQRGVSAGSARCTTAPTRRSSSTTNRQPGRRLERDLELLAANRARNRRTPARCAGATRAREISPVSVSIHSAVICARC